MLSHGNRKNFNDDNIITVIRSGRTKIRNGKSNQRTTIIMVEEKEVGA